ncbi:hypothetical protein FQA39_LY03754 [Lamprigera yunnana]|nr:hypothetical protein FQA39_LY03754 [Lamprigera yunnana]
MAATIEASVPCNIFRDHDFAIHSDAANSDRPTKCEHPSLGTLDRPETSSGSENQKTITMGKSDENYYRDEEDCSEEAFREWEKVIKDKNLLVTQIASLLRMIIPIMTIKMKIQNVYFDEKWVSATLVLAYIMEKLSLTSNDAYSLVKERRLRIQPNEGFFAQLIEYEPIYKTKQVLEHGESSQDNQRYKRKSEHLTEVIDVDLIQPPSSPVNGDNEDMCMQESEIYCNQLNLL